MNRIIKLFERQYGISNDLTYDFALRRLCVRREDSWRGITPSQYGVDFNPEPPIFSAKFANCDNYRHILAIANEDGKIALQDTNVPNSSDAEEKSLEGQHCHYNAVFDLEWVPGQMKFVSASGDHTARLWDITESEFKLAQVFSGHTRSVKTAAFRKTDPAVFATGGRDGAILIWDTRACLNMDNQPRADNCIYSGHVGGPGTPVSHKRKTRQTPKLCPNGASSSITGLVFQDDFTLVSCGAGDGIIKVWDLRRNYSCFKKEPLPKFSLPYAGASTFKGFTNLLVDSAGVRLYANCMDNTIYCYNLSSYSTKPIKKFIGLRNSTFYIKSCLSPDDNYLVSGSSDEKAYIWNVNHTRPLVALSGHSVEVTCVAWSKAKNMSIVTCSDDARHKIWRIGPERIEQDQKPNYRGTSDYCREYNDRSSLMTSTYKSLEYTPRSLRRIVEENETTPSSVEKTTSKKRTFSELDKDDSDNDGEGKSGANSSVYGGDQKRQHLESRGRRLFGDAHVFLSHRQASIAGEVTGITSFGRIREEETERVVQICPVVNHPEDSNQENSCIQTDYPSTSAMVAMGSGGGFHKIVQPLGERVDFNVKSPEPSASSSAIYSPTSNLPNYVVDGDAPHLHLMSPKRRVRQKVDWLTSIRKQKMMAGRIPTAVEKITNLQGREMANDSNNVCHSPRLQSLKAEASGDQKTHGMPKRRNSRSASNSEHQHNGQPKTPTSTRQNSETSILRFFIKSSAGQPQSVAVQTQHHHRVLEAPTTTTPTSQPATTCSE